MTRIEILPGRCIGAGNCVNEADQYFDQDDDDALVVVLQHEVAEGDEALVERAVNSCPVAAIVLENSPGA